MERGSQVCDNYKPLISVSMVVIELELYNLSFWWEMNASKASLDSVACSRL